MAKLASFLRSRQKGWELDRYEFSPWWHKYSMFLNSFLPNLQGEKYSFAEVTLTRLVPFWGDLPFNVNINRALNLFINDNVRKNLSENWRLLKIETKIEEKEKCCVVFLTIIRFWIIVLFLPSFGLLFCRNMYIRFADTLVSHGCQLLHR